MKAARPQVFVGSSTEGKSLATAIQQNLDDDADVTIWDQGVFRLTRSTLESLFDRLDVSDFAIFVFSPDDTLKFRGTTVKAVRDNVIFELGLFMGRLGRERTFIIQPKGARQLQIPTDLAGITIGRYNSKRSDRNLRAASAPFCADILQSIKNLRRYSKKRTSGSQSRTKARAKKQQAKKDLIIETAFYGTDNHRIDVAPALNRLIKHEKVHAFVGNQLGGDPAPGIVKDIVVTYRYQGNRQSLTLVEGDTLDIGKIQ